MIQLYSYFRSSASYRVRIALHLKNLHFETIPVDLRIKAQHDPAYLEVNEQGLVPTLKDSGYKLSQSLVILEYIEKHYPMPALLPLDEKLHWKVRELAQYVACEMHPLNNLRVLQYLTGRLDVDEEAKQKWYAHWMHEGFKVLEKELGVFDTPYALSEHPTWADLCLIPHMYNARRFKVDLTPYKRICAIEIHCLAQDAFQKAIPENQIECDL